MTFSRWLQSRLTAHGYPVGEIDGIVGPITTAALTAFQKANGLNPTGTATEPTVTALRKSSTAHLDAFPRRTSSVEQWPHQSEVSEFYGNVGERQVRVEVPWTMYLAWSKSTRIRRITLHEKCAPSAERVLQSVRATYSDTEIDNLGLNMFGGSLNVRRMRGGKRLSMHSWGIAIDWDPIRNQLHWTKEKARLAQDDAEPFWKAWEAEGWVSLGRARNFDWMHVQAARL